MRALWPLLLLAAGLPVGGSAAAAPFEMSPIRLGVLAFRPVEQTVAQWAPTANYLEYELRGRPVAVVPLTLDTIDQAVAGNQVDFLLANPEQYVMLANRHRLAAVATLMPEINGRPLSRFGGVIFVRAERSDIAKLQDVDEKTIAAVSERSFAGFLIQRWTLQQAGVDLTRRPDRLVFTGLPQDRVVQQVLGGHADVGFVRTGILESLEREGKLRADQLRVINRQPENRHPQYLSTELYPEWPLAVMPEVPDAVIKAVTMALFRLPPDHPASRAGGYYGFAPSGNYASIEALLLRMHLHPDRLLYFGVGEVGRKYAPWLIVAATVLLLAGLALLYRIVTQNRRLSAALAQAERLVLRDDLLDSLSEGGLQDGRVTGAVVAFRDISAQKAAAALHDVLTGLPNRHLLNDRLENALARAARTGDQVAVLFADLDGFKAINDLFGHDAGDVVLIETGRRLAAAVRAVDTVARMGGDEFVLVLADLHAAADAERVAGKLVGLAVEPIADGERRHRVSVSIGIAIFPQHGRDVETLLRVADQGMYAAKKSGRNCWRWGGEPAVAAPVGSELALPG